MLKEKTFMFEDQTFTVKEISYPGMERINMKCKEYVPDIKDFHARNDKRSYYIIKESLNDEDFKKLELCTRGVGNELWIAINEVNGWDKKKDDD